MKLNVIQRNDSLFFNKLCKADEYHLLLVCKKIETNKTNSNKIFLHIPEYD